MNRKIPLQGALGGILISIPLMGIMFLGQQAFGASFPPFDLFTWVSKVLPGAVITFGIDRMIDGLRLLGLNVASAAKTGERLMALALFAAQGALWGAVYFMLVGGTKIKNHPAAGLVFGLVSGAPVILISATQSDSTLALSAHLGWMVVLSLAWGSAIQSVYRQLVDTPTKSAAKPRHANQPRVQKISRRAFLITLGGTSAVITVIGAGLGRLLGEEPGAEQAATATATPGDDLPTPQPTEENRVEPVPGTRPEMTPLEDHFSVFIGLRPPEIDEASWRLPITGMVEQPLSLSLADLRTNYQARHQYVTLRCISGRIGTSLIGTTLWTGVSLQEVLADANIQEGGRYLVITSGDGFYETINLDLVNSDPRIMLTYDWDGKPLPQEHGYPLRIWIPDLYGMKQPKWITGMEVVSHFQDGYWVERGWDIFGRVNTTSVIDTVAVEAMIEKDGQRLIPIGGMAYSGARGISRVDVRVDDGEWQEALLRKPLSDTTWVLWRFEWPYQEGEHTFSVRCFEADGTPQILEKSRIRPNGMTGMHTVEEDI